jgi:hypothetical protein
MNNSRHRDIVETLAGDLTVAKTVLRRRREWTISDIVVWGALDANVADLLLENDSEVDAAYVRANDRVIRDGKNGMKVRYDKVDGKGHKRKLVPQQRAKVIAEELFDPQIDDGEAKARRRSKESYRATLRQFYAYGGFEDYGIDDETEAFGPQNERESNALRMDILAYMFGAIMDALYSGDNDMQGMRFSTEALASDLTDLYVLLSENYKLASQWKEGDPSALEEKIRERLGDPRSYFLKGEEDEGWDAFWKKSLPFSYPFATSLSPNMK